MPPEAVPNAAPAAAPAPAPAAAPTAQKPSNASLQPKPSNAPALRLRDAAPPIKVEKEAPRAPMGPKELAAKLRADILRDSAGKFLGRTEPSNDNAEPASEAVAEPSTEPADAEAQPEEETPAAEPAVEAKPEEPKAEEPKPEEKKADALTALERARAAQKLARVEGQLLEHKANAEKATARVTELEKQLKTFEEARSDINKLLALGKVGHEQLAEMFVKGELNFEPTPEAPPPPPKPERTPEEQEMYEYYKAAKEREAQQAVERARADNVAKVRSAIDSGASDWPVLAALPNGEQALHDAYVRATEANDGDEPHFPTFAKRFNEALTSDLEALTKNEAMRKWLVDKLGIAAPAAAPAAPAKATPAAAEKPAPVAPVSKTLTNKNSAAVPSREPKGRIASTSEMLARIKQMQQGA